jgi:hypothetical protein
MPKPSNHVSGFMNDLCTGGRAKPSRSKYGAVKTKVDGITFDSKKEAKVYQQLMLLQQGRQVVHFERQVPYKFTGNGETITYRADFVVLFADKHTEVWDAKGFKTKEYILKKKLMKIFYNIDIVEV